MRYRQYRKYDDKKLGWLRDGKKFTIILIAVFILLRFVVGISLVSGNSMFPTLKDHQLVVYNRLARNFHRGDVISIRMPSGEYMVKRIIAVAGDSVDIENGVVYINSVAENESWVNGQNTEKQSVTVDYPILLEEGEIFVLGDNREVSIDSRTYGAMALTQTRGRLIGRF